MKLLRLPMWLAPLSLAACQGDDTSNPSTEIQSIGLNAFGSCDELLAYFQAEALAQVQFFGWGMPGGGRGIEDAVNAPTAGGEGEGAAEFTETNVQEAGVDEPDFVKTDGRHVYVGRGTQVLIYDATDLALVSTIELGGYVSGLLLEGDRLAALTYPLASEARPAELPARFGQAGLTGIEVFDVANAAAPSRLRTTQVEGGLVAARLTGGTLRAVVHFDGAWTIQWGVPDGGFGGGAVGGTEPAPAPDSDGREARQDPQVVDPEQAWRDAVEATTLADWVPYRLDSLGESLTAGPIAGCGAFHRPGERAGHGVTAVVSVDLDRLDAPPADSAVVTAPGVVYASQDHLYLATINHAGWLVGGDVAVGVGVAEPGEATEGVDQAAQPLVAEPERQATQIHQLSIADGAAPATYLGSGRVFGLPLNQFSLSEHAGHLRVGTTEDQAEGPTNHLFVLGAGGESGLEIKGQVTDLARTERIYAMRFLGDRGFMVTFRQVDPLFTFDLSDPSRPLQVGELKIPGFSTYLHPLGDHHLIGLGQAATEAGQVTGMQLSLFDVGNLADPTQAHVFDLGSGWSEALYDHHAFTFLANDGLLMLPTDRYDHEAGVQRAGLDLVRVDLATGFAGAGFVTHDSLGFGPVVVRRSLVIGDALLTVSEVGILRSDLDTLQAQAAQAFPDLQAGPRPCDGEADCG